MRSDPFTLFELLKHAFEHKVEQVFVKVKNPTTGLEKILDVGFSPLVYVNTDAILMTMRDITVIREFSKISEHNKMLTILTSSVTHEMITPLRCIIQFASNVLKSTTNPAKKKELELILSTAQLLLSQVKLLLDRNMLDRNIFIPNVEMHPFNATISNVVKILERQAELQQILIAF